MKHSAPSITSLVRAALLGASVRKALTPEQLEHQERLARTMPGSSARGVILPFNFERRDMTAGTANQGGDTVGTSAPSLGDALREAFILDALGAQVFYGLQGNAKFPRGTGSITAEYLSETAQANDDDETLGTLSLAPKRLTAVLEVSKNLFVQTRDDESGIEAFVNRLLASAIAEEMQRKLVKGGGTNEPVGIISTVGIGDVAGGANGAAPTYANILDLEYTPTNAKASRRLAWLMSPKARKKLRNTFTNGTGSAPIFPLNSADTLLGHAAGITPSVPDNLSKGDSDSNCSALIFGDMSELIVGIWGSGIDVLVNPYRKDSEGLVRITATLWFDGGVRNPAAFAAMQDAIC